MDKKVVQALDRIEDARWDYNLCWWYSLTTIVTTFIVLFSSIPGFIIGLIIDSTGLGVSGYIFMNVGLFLIFGCFYVVKDKFLPARKELKGAERAHRDLLDT